MPKYIDAEKYINIIKNDIGDSYTIGLGKSSLSKERLRALEDIIEDLENLEAEDVAPVIHAKWIEDVYQDEPYVCSNCGWAENDDIHRITGGYCVFCGAKMDAEVTK